MLLGTPHDRHSMDVPWAVAQFEQLEKLQLEHRTCGSQNGLAAHLMSA